MQRILFESFYNKIIDNIAKRVVLSNEGFEYHSNLNGIYEEYLNQKTALRYLIKGNAETVTNDTPVLLDGHKVAACLTCAIIRVRPIICTTVDDPDDSRYLLEKSARLNEQVAVLCGLSCLLEYMAEDCNNLLLSSSNDGGTKLIFPKTKYEERSKYLDSLIRGLYYSNLIGNINPLLLSHVYFMIEQYHRKCVEFEEYQIASMQ